MSDFLFKFKYIQTYFNKYIQKCLTTYVEVCDDIFGVVYIKICLKISIKTHTRKYH